MSTESEQAAKRARLAGDGQVAVYVGENGSLGHTAAEAYFKSHPEVELRGVASFEKAFESVKKEEATYAVMPIENSAAGSWYHCQTYNLLVQHDFLICGEYGVRAFYCLSVARPDVELQTVKRVLSHPLMLDACSTFIKQKLPHVTDFVPTMSTTDAAHRVREAAECNDQHSAAVTTRAAASRLGLHVLSDDIGNDSFIEVRYIVMCRPGTLANHKPIPFPHDARNPVRKHSACFALRNEPAAIYKFFACFGMRNIDVMKVETRPMPRGALRASGLEVDFAKLWDYIFFVEWAVPLGQTKQAEANLNTALAEFSLWRHDFGDYMSQTSRGVAKQEPSFAQQVDTLHFG